MLPKWARSKLLTLFSLQPGQGRRTFLVAIHLCLIISSYLMLRSVAKSEFLERFGADNLPYVTIATALLVGLFVALYVTLARRTNPPSLIIGTQLFLISNLLIFWWLARLDVRQMYPVFYVWVSTYGVIAPTQVWILANYLFTTREAKRVFGVVGAGGILGGILGGFATGALVSVVGTASLRLVAVGILAAASVVVAVLSRYRLPASARKDEFGTPRQLLDSLRIVASSPHLRLVAGLVFTAALATKMIDWQFNKVAEVAFATEDARTAFFGIFDGFTGTAAFLFQVFLTSRLLMWMGLGGTILIFPTVLAMATLGSLVPLFSKWAAALARASDQTLKHSIDRSSKEIFYLPVAQTVKVQVKSAIDMLGDRLGDGVSGVVQLGVLHVLAVFTVGDSGKIAGMGLVNLFFLAMWLLLAFRLRRSYVGELSRSIEEGRVRIESWHEVLAGAEALRAVRSALESGEEPRVRAALDLVGGNPEWDLTETLCALAKDDNPEIRARALAILLHPDNPDLPEGVNDAFEAEDQTLLSEIVDLQIATDPEERKERTRAILDRGGGSARGAWIALMVRRLGPEFRPMARVLLEELLRSTSPSSAREVGATALGMIPPAIGVAYLLPPLLADDDPRVASAAARSAAAVGGKLLPAVVPLLGRPGTGKAAREALQSRGDDAVAALRSAVDDGSVDRRSRLRVPVVLARIESPAALSALIEMLRSHDAEVAAAAGDALYRIRLKKPEWALLPPREARELILLQARRCRELTRMLDALEAETPTEASPGWDVLLLSLGAARDRCQDAIFRMLCLQYPPREVLTSKRGLNDKAWERRANAAELLDNLLPRKLSRELLPLLYAEESAGPAARSGSVALRDVVMDLAEGDDPWIRTCAISLAATHGGQDARDAIETSIGHSHPLVREEAKRALERMDGRPNEMNPMSVVEKVVALQGVDVFRETPPDQLALIASVSRQQSFEAGAEICRQDDPPGDMFVLLAGKVRVERDGVFLGELGEGDAIGTWGLFEDEPSKVGATTLEETPVLRIDRMGFEDALQENPEIARSLIQRLIRRLRDLAE